MLARSSSTPRRLIVMYFTTTCFTSYSNVSGGSG